MRRGGGGGSGGNGAAQLRVHVCARRSETSRTVKVGTDSTNTDDNFVGTRGTMETPLSLAAFAKYGRMDGLPAPLTGRQNTADDSDSMPICSQICMTTRAR